jgi:sodium-dependent phosphate cotransporter
MLGVLATVLLQSSSTTTSVIVSMVGAEILTVHNAIYIVMGANIGTTVTNTIVAHGNMGDPLEFSRSFSAGTVHDAFNLLNTLTLLPFEVITGAFGAPFLASFSSAITSGLDPNSGGTFESPIKTIVDPITKAFISVNKDVIKGIAQGCQDCGSNATTTLCWDIKKKKCMLEADFNKKYIDASIIKSGVFSDMDEATGAAFGVILSLVLLCVALHQLVKNLHRIVMSGASRGTQHQNMMVRCLHYALNSHDIISMIIGMLLTIAVQSSSITTSTLTPLAGLGLITLEQMFPLTLGANVGTTCTALLASMVTGSASAVQIAICHLLFNLIGIVLFYPIPRVRQIPLDCARHLGDLVVTNRWFGVIYTVLVFILAPLVLFGVGFLFEEGAPGIVVGTILSVGVIVGTFKFIQRFEKIKSWSKFEDYSERRKRRYTKRMAQKNAKTADSSGAC